MITMQIASTIQAQIGHRAFFMMGAKDLVADERSLQFRIMPNAAKITHVVVELAADDTYTVTFSARRGISYREIKVDSFVYVDQLHSVIESNTGLYLSL